MHTLRLLTRGSALALAQSRWVADRLQAAHRGLTVELRVVRTRGDRITDVPLARIGGKGVFVKEIEDGLLNRDGDIAVHSLKDVPSALPPGLTLAAIPERDDPHDALVLPEGFLCGPAAAAQSREGAAPAEPPLELPIRERGRVGSSSLRRQAQLRNWRPDLIVESLRGNVDTRLRKLDAGEYDAILLAAAGLRRLGLEARISLRLPLARFVPAVGQGALAIEAREDDEETRALLSALEHPPTRACVTAERAYLSGLGGDCVTPLGALATCSDGRLEMIGMLADPAGHQIIRQSASGPAADAAAIGARLATTVLDAGGARLLESLNPSGS
jgi:hydroxymethylbilane synthase